MSCCSPNGCDQFFSDRVARRDAARYRRHGLDRSARRIVDLVRRRGVRDRSILEVGAGVGAIPIELLRAGADRATVAEISPAYGPHADGLLEEAGLGGRVERLLLDFAAQADAVPPADIVILNRVVCCYPDHHLLAGEAAAHARNLLVMTYPRDSWWTRLGIRGANSAQRLMGRDFRVHLHPPASIVAAVEGEGLRQTHLHRGALWEMKAFERPPSPWPAGPSCRRRQRPAR